MALPALNWRSMKYTLMFPLALAFFGTLIPTVQAKDFSGIDTLKCGAGEITMASSCTAAADGEPPHCHQTLSFKQAGRPEKAVTYSPRRIPKRDEPFVTRLACVDVGVKSYVVAQSTNFGNCATCEWKDAFRADGRYVGSTPSIAPALSLPGKTLPARFSSLLGRQPESGGIDISRVR